MSQTQATEQTGKVTRLKSYLQQQVQNGEMYFKSKSIGNEIGMSAKEIGCLMAKLSDADTDLEIEQWSYTSSTTWRVEPA